MRLLVLALLVTACADDRRPVDTPFITCPVSDVYERDTGTWVGTVTELIGPPGAFPETLAGAPLDASLVGYEDDKLEVIAGTVGEDGAFYALVRAESTDLRELPVRVSVGPTSWVVHPPAERIPVDLDHSPPIIEDPDGLMSFAATLPEPLELGAFWNLSTLERIELEVLEVGEMRIDAHLTGHEGHKALAGVRARSGVACFHTPCGCSEELRRLGRCGPPPLPSSDPVEGDEPI